MPITSPETLIAPRRLPSVVPPIGSATNRMEPSAASVPASRTRWYLLGLAGLVVLAALLGASVGAVPIPPLALLGIVLHKLGVSGGPAVEMQEAVLWAIRLPRVVLGLLVGAGLGVAGTAIQGLFRNPLADPSLVGISAGASLAAVSTLVLGGTLFGGLTTAAIGAGLGLYLLPLMAFVGAGLTTLLVYQLARVGGRVSVASMLLVGIAINGLAAAGTGLLTYTATDQQLRNITFWSLGSLGGATWPTVGVLFPFLLLPLFWLPRLGKQLNLLALGEEPAAHLGVRVPRLKRQLILLATLAVGASVALVGTIGFLGFLVPHVMRLLAGPDHRFVLPASALGGAVVLVLADMLARTAVAPAELPIGILTALLGAPIFLVILVRQQRQLVS